MPGKVTKQAAAQPSYPEMANKVALVTGGSSGIGFATARAFPLQGARAMFASRGKTAASTEWSD